MNAVIEREMDYFFQSNDDLRQLASTQGDCRLQWVNSPEVSNGQAFEGMKTRTASRQMGKGLRRLRTDTHSTDGQQLFA